MALALPRIIWQRDKFSVIRKKRIPMQRGTGDGGLAYRAPEALRTVVIAEQGRDDAAADAITTTPTTASADWITMGLDGRYAYLSSADIVDVKTKKIVGQMKDEFGRPMHSEKFLELAFRETPGKEYGTVGEVKLVRTVSQFGQGIQSAVQARLAGRTTSAKAK